MTRVQPPKLDPKGIATEFQVLLQSKVMFAGALVAELFAWQTHAAGARGPSAHTISDIAPSVRR